MHTGIPIYVALAERIRKAIRSGGYEAGQRIGSEHELARHEKVARVTVRRTTDLLIQEGLIERRPGKGLYVRGPESPPRLVKVIVGNLNWEPSVQVARGARSAAVRHGVETQLYDAHGDIAQDLAMLRQLPGNGTAGAIILSLHSPTFNQALFELRSRDFPFVLVDQNSEALDVSTVTADNRSGGYQVGQMLLAQGHRRIGFVGDLIATTVRDRLEGLRDAVSDAGLPFDRSLVADLTAAAQDRLGDWSAAIEQGTLALLGGPSRPTAIFFSCDAVARPAYRALARMGCRVPQDLSVVGFDDDPLAEWLTPALTTVRQPFFDMGCAAMELLARQMADAKAQAKHRLLPVTLINRESVAPSLAGPPKNRKTSRARAPCTAL